MMELTPYLLVGAGSAVGGILRYGLSQAIDAHEEVGAFPWGILMVNVIGCLAMGVAFVLLERTPLKLLVMSGILGGFTTFSAFSLISLEEFFAMLLNGRLALQHRRTRDIMIHDEAQDCRLQMLPFA